MAAPKSIIPAGVRDLIARAVAEPDVTLAEDLLRRADDWSAPVDAPAEHDPAFPVFERVPGETWWRRVTRGRNRPFRSTFH